MRKVVTCIEILLLFFLQTTIFPKLTFLSVVPNLLLILTVVNGFVNGKKSGLFTGFFCGLLIDIFYSNLFGFYALVYMYIGYLSIPALGLELPVMSEWDYNRLNIAPCRYSGSTKTDDLVIAAHNFAQHFGGLSGLTGGEQVIFVDMDNVVSTYTVVAVEILAPTAVEEMTNGEYDLSLYTCTYGGRSRVTVRCDRTEG